MALPSLLKQDGFVLTSALELADRYQLDISGLDNDSLRKFVTNAKLPAKARSTALEILIRRKPENLGNFLTKLSNDSSDEVVLTALAAIADLSPDSALAPLTAAVNSSNLPRAQRTWSILASLPDGPVDALFVSKLGELQASNGISPSAIELTAAAGKRTSDRVKTALAALEKSLSENKDPLAKWNSALEGGNPSAGAALFQSHPASECMRCHRAEEGHAAGSETAPNLAGIANRHKDRRYFLQSMVDPSAVIAPGFGSVLVDFKNGASLTGNLIAETPDYLDMDAAGKSLRIRRSDIASFTPPASPMPPMAGLLNPSELRDIVAWLASLNQGGNLAKTTSPPVPLDPATLEIPAKTPTTPASAVDPALLKTGQQQFMVCGACHGLGGEGTAAGPPLAGSEWVNGPEENLIRIQLRGLQGPITVKGQTYNFPGGMAAQAYQTDDQIAAVLTYIRNSFGNSAPAVSASAVAALRGEVGKPQLASADLTPLAAQAPLTTTSASPTAGPGKYDDLKPESSSRRWLAIVIGIFVLGTLAQGLRRK